MFLYDFYKKINESYAVLRYFFVFSIRKNRHSKKQKGTGFCFEAREAINLCSAGAKSGFARGRKQFAKAVFA
ncbi:MAG: hypothetical protein LUG52_01085, partial [Clostridia bacterium]|nr:hypothetical protein [Clostridia bacterium]